jgi:hypothetical protein
MDLPEPTEQSPRPTRAPAAGLRMMALILVAFALLALYANIQKGRRDRIETVTIVPAAAPSPTPARPNENQN